MTSQDSIERDIFTSCRTVAVVGASPDPDRPSYHVASYLIGQGFDVIPVNPRAEEILKRKCYPSLTSIPRKVDVVDVFRRPEDAVSIAQEAIDVGARVLWLQEGVINERAAALARQAGLFVVMDRCMGKEHARLSLRHVL